MTVTARSFPVALCAALLTAAGLNAGTAAAAGADDEAPTLFSPLAVSPAQQAAVNRPRLDAAFNYLSENVRQSTVTGGTGPSGSPLSDPSASLGQPVIEAGAVLPLGPVRVGFTAAYTTAFYKEAYGSADGASGLNLAANGTTSSGTAFVAANVSKTIAIGAEYLYEDFAVESNVGLQDGADTTKEWGNRGKLGVEAKLDDAKLGLAFASLLRRRAGPPELIAYGEKPLTSTLTPGFQIIYRFNKEIDNDATGPEDAADIFGTLSVRTSRSNHLVFLLGYLPETNEIEATRTSVLRDAGWGWRLTADWEHELRADMTLGLGFTYDTVASDEGGRTSGSGVGLSSRLSLLL